VTRYYHPHGATPAKAGVHVCSGAGGEVDPGVRRDDTGVGITRGGTRSELLVAAVASLPVESRVPTAPLMRRRL
jgi:hypothetical protein